MKLIISNRATSPWPLRVWLVMRTFGISFEEELVDLSLPDKKARLKAVSPSGRVPVLVDGDTVVWESLAIVEYLADKLPALAIWPRDQRARAHARAVANEMHAGFLNLRRRCVMNMTRPPASIELDEDVRMEVTRVVEIWESSRHRFGQGGPFLFGDFTAADAMYAPVVSRLHTYQIPVPPGAEQYMQAIMGLPGWHEWLSACHAGA